MRELDILRNFRGRYSRPSASMLVLYASDFPAFGEYAVLHRQLLDGRSGCYASREASQFIP